MSCSIHLQGENKGLTVVQPASGEKPKINVQFCPHCGFRHQVPLPDAKAVAKFYEQNYVVKPGVRRAEDYHWQTLTILDRIKAFHPKPKTLLDVGAGTSQFALVCRQHGIETFTVEPGNIVDADYRSLEEIQDQTFEAVTLFKVLEHVLDPKDFLQKSINVLEPGGTLVIDVPRDYDRLQMATQPYESWVYPEHINYFTRETLTNLLSSFGLTVYYETTSFPTALFNGDGREAHKKRKALDLVMTQDQRMAFYEQLASFDLGREIIFYARKGP